VSAVDDPQITTVIPTFRRPRLLRRAVESVLAQTYPHLEVAVVDNASGDETSEVVADLARRDPRVRYSCHSENLGPVANFQAGMDSVTTPYFSFLCDDDLLLPDFYRHALECIRREPRAGFFCGQTVIYDSELGSHYVKPTRPWSNGLYEAGRTTARMVDAGFIWTAVLFALEVRERLGPFEGVSIVDTLFMAKAAAQFPFVVSLAPCAVRTSWRGRIFDTLSADQFAEAYRITAERLARFPGVPASEARFIAAILERKRQGIMSQRLRSSFLSGDWDSFDQAAEFLSRQGRLTWGKKMRVFVAKQRKNNPAMVRAVQGLLRGQRFLRLARRKGGSVATMEGIVQRYGAVLSDRGPSGCGAANPGELEAGRPSPVQLVPLSRAPNAACGSAIAPARPRKGRPPK